MPFWLILGSGGTLGPLGRPVGSRDPLPKIAWSHFKRFWIPTGPQRCPTTAKIKKIQPQNRCKNRCDVGWAFGAALVDLGGAFGNLDPRKFVFRIREVLIFK